MRRHIVNQQLKADLMDAARGWLMATSVRTKSQGKPNVSGSRRDQVSGLPLERLKDTIKDYAEYARRAA
jgi:hypothetical protein